MHYTKLFILQEMRPQPSNTSGLRFISGIICKSKVLRFERMLFRATRGNMLFNQAPAGEQIMDPVSTEMVFFFLITFIWWLIIWHSPPPQSVFIILTYSIPSWCIFPLMYSLSIQWLRFLYFSFQIEKTVFVVFFSGEQARTKILKICEAFGANCYPVPEDISKQRQITREVSVLSLGRYYILPF